MFIHIWNTVYRPSHPPHYVKDKKAYEKVQHRLTRMIPGLRSMHYEDRLQDLGLSTLEERRNRADFIEVQNGSWFFDHIRCFDLTHLKGLGNIP